MLRWVFRRDTDAITCELDARGRHSYDVCVVPHWNVSSAVIEHYDTPAAALLRHAEIARRLRDHGWMLADHAATALPVAA